MHRRAPSLARATLVATLLAAGVGTPLAGQDDGPNPGDVISYGAPSYTPLGALPPVARADLGGTAARRMAVHALFGYADQVESYSRRSYGLGVDLPVGRSTFTFVGGFIDFACDEDAVSQGGSPTDVRADCRSGYMGGASWFMPLVRAPVGASERAAITVGVDGAIGASTFDAYEFAVDDSANPEPLAVGAGASVRSAAIGFPLALPVRSGGITIIPHMTPRYTFGRVSVKFTDSVLGTEDDTQSGTRFMLGGGIGILFASSGVGVDVGFQHVFIEDMVSLVGVGVSYRRR